MKSHVWHGRFGKPLAHLLASGPLLWLVLNWGLLLSGHPHDLGFNPQETTNRVSGDWAMRVLLLTLAVTPLVQMSGNKAWITYRRMLGLWAFAYSCLHITAYLGIDLMFDFAALVEDLFKRTYITVGMAAFLMLIPLAWTSRASKVRQMGARSWRRLHSLVYGIGPLVILHFVMMRKGFQLEPLIYGAILALLLASRIKLSAVRLRLGW